MQIETGLSETQRSAIGALLSKFLADSYVLYLKTQCFHWNLTGPEFFSLHKLFETQYEELAIAIDEIAERIRALGFYVEGSMEAFLKATSIQEAHRVLPIREILEQLIQGHEILIREGRKLASVAEKQGDAATVDLLGRRLGAHEKQAWMLRSQI